MIGVRPSVATLLAAVLAAGAASVHSQQLYRWTDEKGRVHVTDTPPPASAKDVQKKSYRSAPAEGGQVPFELDQAMKDFPVTLYTAPTCVEPCANARRALNQRGVPFKEVQVTDAQSAEELKRVSGGEQVPVLVVGRSVHTGFLQSAYDSLLDAARYPKAGSVPPRAQARPGDAAPAKPEPEEPKATGPYAPGAPPQKRR